MDSSTKGKLLRFLLKGLGWCFLLEALLMTLGLGFVLKASSLVGIHRLVEIPEPMFSPSLELLWGSLIIASALTGYYLLAYAFIRQRQWGIPVAIFLNALLFIHEIWRLIFPWKISREHVLALVQDIATRGGYKFNDQVFEETWSVVTQPTTPLDLAGRGGLIILLFILYGNRAYLASVLK